MAEKTEKPTDKKIRDARKKGQVPKSQEVTSGIQLVALLGYFMLDGRRLLRSFTDMIALSIKLSTGDIRFAMGQMTGMAVAMTEQFLFGLAAIVVISTVLSVVAQTGPLLASEALQPSFNKVNPLSNFKQKFSLASLFELAKSLFKVCLLSLIFYYLLRQYGPSLQMLPLHSSVYGLTITVQLVQWMWAALIGFYAVIGVADYGFQYRKSMKELMMSHDEIKQEYKNTEGDPEIKKKRKEVHKEIQSGSLSENVKKSTAVVRNPTHLAICLYYRAGETPLPQVLEIGRDKWALHIIRLAEQAGVPVIEHVPLARALAATTKAGLYIPAELFEPVAQILRIAMNLEYDADEESEVESA